MILVVVLMVLVLGGCSDNDDPHVDSPVTLQSCRIAYEQFICQVEIVNSSEERMDYHVEAMAGDSHGSDFMRNVKPGHSRTFKLIIVASGEPQSDVDVQITKVQRWPTLIPGGINFPPTGVVTLTPPPTVIVCERSIHEPDDPDIGNNC